MAASGPADRRMVNQFQLALWNDLDQLWRDFGEDEQYVRGTETHH